MGIKAVPASMHISHTSLKRKYTTGNLPLMCLMYQADFELINMAMGFI